MKTHIQNLFIILALLAASISAYADTLYVSNIYTNHVKRFTAGGVGSVFANTGSGPLGLAFDSAGNLYVGMQSINTIVKFSSTGTNLGIFASTGANPYALAFDSVGNLYVANAGDNTIAKITPGGVSSVFANTGLFYPAGLAFDSAGNLYVANANNNNINKFSSTGTNLGVFASSGGGAPAGLAFDSAGNLYVANQTGAIVKITTNGTGSVFANIGATPFGLAFDTTGNLYVTYNQLNTIEKFSPTGTDLGVFASNLNGPAFIAIRPDSATTLRIAQSGNQSVLFWPASGTNYILQSSTNLASTNWITATDAIPVIAFTVTNTSPARFFRLMQP